jgi:uncharacterized protein YbjQ (UPF0145 family)
MNSSPDSLPVLTVDHLPEGCSEVLGLVTASCVMSKSLVGDVAAHVKNWTVGGELGVYTRMLDQAMEILVARIRDNAFQRGASAVIGFRVVCPSVSAGSADLIGYGTAVR